MKTTYLNLAVTVDGFISRIDGSVDFLDNMNEDMLVSFNEFLAKIDVIIMGSRTYLEYKDYGFDLFKNQRIYVLSNSLESDSKEITILGGKVLEKIKTLKENKSIWCFGGSSVVKYFMENELIDEFYITTVPFIIGDGIRLFDNGSYSSKLSLVDSINIGNNITTIYKKT